MLPTPCASSCRVSFVAPVFSPTSETPAPAGRDPRAEFAAGIARADAGFRELRSDLLLLIRKAHVDLEEQRTARAAELPAAALAEVREGILMRVLRMGETASAIGLATDEIRSELLPRLQATGEEAFAALAALAAPGSGPAQP